MWMLPLLGYCEFPAMNMGVQISFDDPTFKYLVYTCLGVRDLLKYMSVLFKKFWGTSVFSIVVAQFYNPTNSAQVFNFFPHRCRHLLCLLFFFFYSSHPRTCEVVFHCSFDLVSIQILFLFLKFVLLDFFVEFQKFFVYSGYWPLIRYDLQIFSLIL